METELQQEFYRQVSTTKTFVWKKSRPFAGNLGKNGFAYQLVKRIDSKTFLLWKILTNTMHDNIYEFYMHMM